MWGSLVPIVFLFMAFGGMTAIVRLIEGHRTFRLELKEKEVRVAEARAKELEVTQQRADLEYRQALLELERFDRRTGRSPHGPLIEPTDAAPAADPPDLNPGTHPTIDPPADPEPPPGRPGPEPAG